MVKVVYRKLEENKYLYYGISGKHQVGRGISSFEPVFNKIERTVLTSGICFKKVTICKEC